MSGLRCLLKPAHDLAWPGMTSWSLSSCRSAACCCRAAIGSSTCACLSAAAGSFRPCCGSRCWLLLLLQVLVGAMTAANCCSNWSTASDAVCALGLSSLRLLNSPMRFWLAVDMGPGGPAATCPEGWCRVLWTHCAGACKLGHVFVLPDCCCAIVVARRAAAVRSA